MQNVPTTEIDNEMSRNSWKVGLQNDFVAMGGTHRACVDQKTQNLALNVWISYRKLEPRAQQAAMMIPNLLLLTGAHLA